MRFLPFALLTACALAPRPARALFCQSPAAIEAQLELCDDNEKFAAAAEACRNDYLRDVKAEQDKLGKQLRKNVAGAKDAGVQRASEALSASSYDATLARLDVLIARGVATHAEELDYLSHFLPPFHWPTAELGPMPGKDDPALWKAYDGEFCFGEHKETIDHMVKDIDQAVSDLRKARKEAEELKTSSLTHKAQLGNDGAKAVSGGKGDSAHGAGPKAPSGQSDITGVEQDKDKAKQPQ